MTACGSPVEAVAVYAEIAHSGAVEIGGCRDFSPGVVGLLLAEQVARYCALNPATQADRIAVEASRKGRGR
ncbi:hypothetical protein [Aeromicrobium sp.]|uniref:hypothetical protein n=1 Tax=Aeromicrobium sp. TaxID=1871063 RepID=UPI0030BA3A8D